MKKFNEEVLKQEGKHMVVFKAPWCQPCKNLTPLLEELANEGHSIFEVNTDTDQESAVKYQIRSVPTIKIFENGTDITTTTGAKTRKDLLKLFALEE